MPEQKDRQRAVLPQMERDAVRGARKSLLGTSIGTGSQQASHEVEAKGKGHYAAPFN